MAWYEGTVMLPVTDSQYALGLERLVNFSS